MIRSIVKVFTLREYQESDNHANIEMEVPYVTIEETPEGEAETKSDTEDKINADIERIAQELTNEYKKALEEESPDISITMDYEILSSTDFYFTLKINCFEAIGGGYERNEFYTIDCKTGEKLELADLFQANVDYITPISENIIEQMKTQMTADENVIYFLNSKIESDNFTEIKKDQNFYINKEHNLVIAFDEYEVAAVYMDAVEFVIPDEVIESIRKN